MSASSVADTQATVFEDLYGRYTRRDFVHPDPLEFLYRFDDSADREIVALIASSLAYGRVAQILNSIERVLDRMPRPAAYVRKASAEQLRRDFENFRHRFTSGEELAALLWAAKQALHKHGSLKRCFSLNLIPADETVLPALNGFVLELNALAGVALGHLLPAPADGSACKRLHLLLRWLIRKDAVDLGDWGNIGARRLIVPLDTHMHRICRALGLTQRNAADGRAAIEVTAAFAKLSPDDPVKYDFALSRLGIRKDADWRVELRDCIPARLQAAGTPH